MNAETSWVQTTFRIILGAFMTFAGIGHLTFQREEFLAQVPRWLPSDPAFMDFVVLSSGVVEILLGLAMIFLYRHKCQGRHCPRRVFCPDFPGKYFTIHQWD